MDYVLEDAVDEYGDMVSSRDSLEDAVVGHRIVDVGTAKDSGSWGFGDQLEITLDNGKKVLVHNTSDCCAYGELNNFLVNVENIDHIITGVGTTDGFETWHIYADMGDVLQLGVSWSGSNGYYAYGFKIEVVDA